ncbi:C45 family peptidase [Winogradskyella aurantia]|nr:hypothetical protein [Winogradskyella aurantia]
MNKSIKRKILRRKIFGLYILITSFFVFIPSYACTIFSGVDCNGQVWNANNEDGPEGIANFINVFPKTNDTKYGYYTLSYFSPANGEGGNIQGGMNEVGLTFDFNAIAYIEGFDLESKKKFTEGDDAILPHILGNMSSVKEVIDFFDNYWFQKGFLSAQMHVADRNGQFAIISASGTQMVEKGQPLVSTNFDICGNEDSSSCWRYPVATEKLTKLGASLSTMLSICQETAQNNNGIVTMYSNIQNLTTGEIWFFSIHDPNIIINTNINELLAKGRKSYTFSNLKSLKEANERKERKESTPVELEPNKLNKYLGTYTNMMVGEIKISLHENGLQFSSPFGSEMLYPQTENTFYLPNTSIRIEFVEDSKSNRKKLRYIEDWYWSFSAWRDDLDNK